MKSLLSLFAFSVLVSCGTVTSKVDTPATVQATALTLDGGAQSFRALGVAHERWTTPQGTLTLLILPTGSHEWNRLAFTLSTSHFGLKLVYNPTDLARAGANAIFDPANNIIGISHQMVSSGKIDEAFAHEMVHADNFAARARGNMTGMHIVSRLVGAGRMSERSHDAYVRHMAFEELVAYVRSVSFLTKSGSASALDDESVSDLYNAVAIGAEISNVIEDVSKLARTTRSNLTLTNVTKGGQPFVEIAFDTDSFDRVFSNGSPTVTRVSNGTRVTLTVSSTTFGNSNRDQATELFQKALTDAESKAVSLQAHFKEALAAFGYVLEQPRRAEINFAKLDAAAARIRALDVQ